MVRRYDGRDLCIMCGNKPGFFRTLDGLVCEECMPDDLIPRAETLHKHNIVIYRKTNRSWKSCGYVPVPEEKPVKTDRSMAITPSSGTILADELIDQINASVSIDIIVSFIRTSGINVIIDSLRDFTRRGKLRVITTSYLGATEYPALEELFDLPNTEVRMELCTDRSRLHAKGFIFRGADGNSTAFVGSANISGTALTAGTEWVVKLREKDFPEIITDLRKSFDDIWNSGRVRKVSRKDRAEIESALEFRGR